jgi:hypothetical protein
MRVDQIESVIEGRLHRRRQVDLLEQTRVGVGKCVQWAFDGLDQSGRGGRPRGSEEGHLHSEVNQTLGEVVGHPFPGPVTVWPVGVGDGSDHPHSKAQWVTRAPAWSSAWSAPSAARVDSAP